MKQLTTLYKRELKILFLSPIGWLFNALNLLALGIFAALMHLRGGLSSFEASAEAATLIFCLSIPLLTALSSAAEIKRGETDMMTIYTTPAKVIISKFLAGLTAFAPSVVMTALLPLILNSMSRIDLAAAYLGVLGYILCGIALLSMCTYIAIAVGRTLPALGVSLVTSVLLTLLSNVTHTIGHRHTLPFTVIILSIVFLITVALYFYLNDLTVSIVFVVISSVLVAIFNQALPEIVCELASIIAPQHVFSSLIYGTLSVGGIIAPLMFTAVFTVLSVFRLLNRKERKR